MVLLGYQEKHMSLNSVGCRQHLAYVAVDSRQLQQTLTPHPFTPHPLSLTLYPAAMLFTLQSDVPNLANTTQPA